MSHWLSFPRVQAKNCGPARTRAPASLLVLHTMESPEKPGTAKAVANWFGGRLGTAPRASAHFCVDGVDTIQCVALDVVGWHAPGVNSRAVGIEQAGRAKQTAAEWDDAESRAMLARSARLCAELCEVLSIPPVRLDAAAVKAGKAGICGHVDVTRAFPEKGSGHFDPGPNFPWNSYMAAVVDELERRQAPAPVTAPPLDPRTLPVLDLVVPRMKGKHVRLAQERLVYWMRPVTVDGNYGPLTAAAVLAFQKSRGIDADGRVDAETWMLLLKDMG